MLEGETPTAWEKKEQARRIPPCLAQGQGVLSSTIAQHPAVTPCGLAEGSAEGDLFLSPPPLPVGGWGGAHRSVGLRPPQKLPRPALIRSRMSAGGDPGTVAPELTIPGGSCNSYHG